MREVEADLVLNAIVGFAGLESTLAALEAGVPLALANKESLVCAGRLVTELAARPGRAHPAGGFGALGPVPAGRRPRGRRRSILVITASGGPFRGRTAAELGRRVTREQALAHPTWSMGEKITIDSATLMNKGLEVIEAHHLFGLPYERIEVVVHPQSLVHALVRLVDGALLAHLGMPDMRVPIAYALHYPERVRVATPRLDLAAGLSLEFAAPDEETFPAIRLAREAGAGATAPPAPSTPPTKWPCGRSWMGACPSWVYPRWWRRSSSESEAGAFGTYEEVAAVDQWARRMAARHVCAIRRGTKVSMVSTFVGIVVAIVGLGFLILAHEFGHFIVAKATGMRVEEFSLGFGRYLVSRRIGETVYGISCAAAGRLRPGDRHAREEFEARIEEAREKEAESGRAETKELIAERTREEAQAAAGPRGPAGRTTGAERRRDRVDAARAPLLLAPVLAQAALHHRRRGHEHGRRLPAHLHRGADAGRELTDAP